MQALPVGGGGGTKRSGWERLATNALGKPFGYGELRCRIGALLRRTQDRPAHGAVRVGPLVVDPVSREVRLDDVVVDVSQKEFALLRVLIADATRVFTKDELVHAVWGAKSLGSSRTLDSHACRLRQKLAGSEQQFIVNVWGVGYRLLDAGAAAR